MFLATFSCIKLSQLRGDASAKELSRMFREENKDSLKALAKSDDYDGKMARNELKRRSDIERQAQLDRQAAEQAAKQKELANTKGSSYDTRIGANGVPVSIYNASEAMKYQTNSSNSNPSFPTFSFSQLTSSSYQVPNNSTSNNSDFSKSRGELQQQILDGAWSAAKGIGEGLFNSAKSMVNGFVDAVKHPIDTAIALKHMQGSSPEDRAFQKQMVDTLTIQVKNAYNQDVTNGDIQSQFKFFSQGVFEVGSAVIGTKGVGPVLKTTKLAKVAEVSTVVNKTEDLAKTAQRIENLKTPQGLTTEQFNNASKLIKDKVGSISDDVVVHGSRANGTARADSDIDFAVRVSPEKFNELIKEKFKTPNPGSAKEDTMLHAIDTGKIQSGEAGLRGLRKELEGELGMEVHISVIKIGGPFDNGKTLPLKN
jgi:hypothetical protein